MDATRFFRDLPRRSFSPFLGTVPNDFSFSNAYVQSMCFLLFLGAVAYIGSLLLLLLCRCCRSKCGRGSDPRQAYGDTGLTEGLTGDAAKKGCCSCCAPLLVVLLLVLALAAAVLTTVGAIYVRSAGNVMADQVQANVNPTLTSALDEIDSLRNRLTEAYTAIEDYNSAVAGPTPLSCATECGTNEAVCTGAVTSLEAALDPAAAGGLTEVLAGARTLLQTPANFAVNFPDQTRVAFDGWVFGSVGLALLVVVILLSMAWRRMRTVKGGCLASCCGTICTALSLLTMLVLWVGSGTQLAGGAMMADLCTDWTGGALRALLPAGEALDPATQPYTWLLQCPAGIEGPFETDLAAASDAINAPEVTAAEVIITAGSGAAPAYTTEACVTHAASLSAALTAMSTDIGDITDKLVGPAACAPIQTAWTTVEAAWCTNEGNESGVNGMALGVMALGALGLISTLLMGAVCCNAPVSSDVFDDDEYIYDMDTGGSQWD